MTMVPVGVLVEAVGVSLGRVSMVKGLLSEWSPASGPAVTVA
jgi:hypothetical protein